MLLLSAAMELTAIILILFSTVLHAGWNLISKSGKPSAAFFTILTLAALSILSPILIYAAPAIKSLPPRFWYLLIATGFFQAIYYSGLAMSFRLGDISLVYPLVRALPVLLIPLISSLFKRGAPLSALSVSGMFLIGAGCLFIPIRRFASWHFRDYINPSLPWILAGAAGTTGYTIIDSEAMDIMTDIPFPFPVSLVYSSLLSLVILLWMALPLTLLSSWKELRFYKGRKLLQPLAAAIALTLSYMLILASMPFVSNVSYVSAFRQFSIPLGVLGGTLFFKEKLSPPRIAGIIIIMAGLIITALN